MKTAVNKEKNNFITYLFIPLSLIFYEAMVRLLTGSFIDFKNAIACVLISLAAGAFFNIIFSLTKIKVLNNILAFLFIELSALLFLMTYYIFSCYKSYMDIKTILAGAEGVIAEFSNSVLALISRGIWIILLFEIPAILFILFFFIFRKLGFSRNKKKTNIVFLLIFICCEIAGLGIMTRNASYRMKMTSEYNFDLVLRTFSVQTAYKLDLIYILIPNPFNSKLENSVNYFNKDNQDYKHYGYSQLNYDYKGIAQATDNTKIQILAEYIDSLEPSSKNVYSGLFKGKNIIFITVESMSKEMIRPDTTPTLAKLANEGIVFEDFYQPYYNGSTATGEFANLLGLIPTEAMTSFRQTANVKFPFTLGNQTINKGYKNTAYHNGTLEYYNRFITHLNFGYSEYIADGNGMETALSDTWPRSDLEMFKYSVPQYIDKEPFCIYYMTLSGHFPYMRDYSVMVDKYWSRVQELAYSDIIKTYFCSEIDFEESLSYLLEQLEKQGIADNTVLILSPDHYPYGLTKSDAWAADKNYLPELYGYEPENMAQRDHNCLIIWSKSMENSEPIIVSDPVYSVDILPTLLNLFGMDYDSRLFAGRDVFSNARPLVIWPDYSWLTEKGYYNSCTDTFTPNDGESVDASYVSEIQSVVKNKMIFSRLILETDFYNTLD